MNIRRAKKQATALQKLYLRETADTIADRVVERTKTIIESIIRKDEASDIAWAKRIIPVRDFLDDVEKNTSCTNTGAENPIVLEAIKTLAIMSRNFDFLLEEKGIQRINPVNQPVDYAKHDVALVMATERPELDGLVAETLRVGYSTKMKSIRPAMVTVWKYDPKPCQMADNQ